MTRVLPPHVGRWGCPSRAMSPPCFSWERTKCLGSQGQQQQWRLQPAPFPMHRPLQTIQKALQEERRARCFFPRIKQGSALDSSVKPTNQPTATHSHGALQTLVVPKTVMAKETAPPSLDVTPVLLTQDDSAPCPADIWRLLNSFGAVMTRAGGAMGI